MIYQLLLTPTLVVLRSDRRPTIILPGPRFTSDEVIRGERMTVVEDKVIPVAGRNQEMGDAIDEARASIHEFFVAFEYPKPNQHSFLIKARFEDEGASEHIWLADLDFKTKPATGVVSNEPDIKSLTYMERVGFLPDQISDWMYMEDGRLVGGFTTKVLMRASSKRGGLMSLLKQAFKM